MDGRDSILLLCRAEYITKKTLPISFSRIRPTLGDQAAALPLLSLPIALDTYAAGWRRGGRTSSPCPLAPPGRASSVPHRLRLPNTRANDRRSAVARCCCRRPRVRSLHHQAKSYHVGTVRHGGRPPPVRDPSVASSPGPSSNHNIRRSHLCSRGCISGFDVLLLKK